jgi:hypothetical protein
LQDPLQIDSYLLYNIFLPDINNERDDKNTNYADNLAALQRLVLFRFDEDTTGEFNCVTTVVAASQSCWHVQNLMKVPSGSTRHH